MTDHECPLFVSDCHVRAAVLLVEHRWDAVVVSALRSGPTRRADLLRSVAGVSDKVLTESLRRLVARGLVIRPASGARCARQGGVAVYELTALGASFAAGPLAHMAQWAADHQGALVPG